MAIIGFPPDGPRLGPPREVRLSAEQAVAELDQVGFTLTERHAFLPRQYLLVFETGRYG